LDSVAERLHEVAFPGAYGGGGFPPGVVPVSTRARSVLQFVQGHEPLVVDPGKQRLKRGERLSQETERRVSIRLLQ